MVETERSAQLGAEEERQLRELIELQRLELRQEVAGLHRQYVGVAAHVERSTQWEGCVKEELRDTGAALAALQATVSEQTVARAAQLTGIENAVRRLQKASVPGLSPTAAADAEAEAEARHAAKAGIEASALRTHPRQLPALLHLALRAFHTRPSACVLLLLTQSASGVQAAAAARARIEAAEASAVAVEAKYKALLAEQRREAAAAEAAAEELRAKWEARYETAHCSASASLGAGAESLLHVVCFDGRDREDREREEERQAAAEAAAEAELARSHAEQRSPPAAAAANGGAESATKLEEIW